MDRTNWKAYRSERGKLGRNTRKQEVGRIETSGGFSAIDDPNLWKEHKNDDDGGLIYIIKYYERILENMFERQQYSSSFVHFIDEHVLLD